MIILSILQATWLAPTLSYSPATPSKLPCWNQVQGRGQNDGYARTASVSPPLSVKWISTAFSNTAPAPFGKRVYSMSDSGLTAIDEDTGSVVWQYPAGGTNNVASPACETINGITRIYFTTAAPSYGEIHCVDDLGSAPAAVWTRVLDGAAAVDVTLARHQLYITLGWAHGGSPGIRVGAFSTADGATVWMHDFGYGDTFVKHAVHPQSGALFVLTNYGLYAFDAQGNQLWRNAYIGGISSFSLDFKTNRLYGIRGDYDASLVCVDALSGALLWDSYNVNGFRSSNPFYLENVTPALANGLVYVCSSYASYIEPYVAAFDPQTGIVVWRTILPRDPSISVSDLMLIGCPLVTQNGLLWSSANNGVFFCLDALTGAFLWRGDTGMPWDARNTPWAFGIQDKALYWMSNSYYVLKLAP